MPLRWNGIQGKINVRFHYNKDMGEWTTADEYSFSGLFNSWASHWLDKDKVEGVYSIHIDFESSGFYDGGVCLAPVDNCAPPDSEDIRTLEYCEIQEYDNHAICPPSNIADDLWDTLEEQIYEIALDIEEN